MKKENKYLDMDEKLWLPIGLDLTFGGSLGLFIGLFLDNMSLGISIGTGIGMLLGIIFQISLYYRKAHH